MRVFQNRILSGSPSRSRGPGNSSRKKSASWASKDRKPFGTILMSWWSEVGVVGVTAVPDPPTVEGGCTLGVTAAEPMLLGLGRWVRKCRRSSARSVAVVYRSDARLDNDLRQIR